MRCRSEPDPLAVWTYDEAGEEIPVGDPSVTDAERAAAGRETLAERFAALLPGNRSRAASQYAEGGLPDGQDIVRVWRPRDPAELRARLSEPPLAVWPSRRRPARAVAGPGGRGPAVGRGAAPAVAGRGDR